MTNLYIANLSYSVEEKQVKELFEKFGEVESIRIFSERGFGFVNFVKDADAKEALSLDGETFLDRPLRVDVAKPRKEYPDRYKS